MAIQHLTPTRGERTSAVKHRYAARLRRRREYGAPMAPAEYQPTVTRSEARTGAIVVIPVATARVAEPPSAMSGNVPPSDVAPQGWTGGKNGMR